MYPLHCPQHYECDINVFSLSFSYKSGQWLVSQIISRPNHTEQNLHLCCC